MGKKAFLINQLKVIQKYMKKNQKIITGQRDDYTTSSLLDRNYFKKHYKMIVIDLSKQQAFDSYSKAIQQSNFTGNLDGINNRLKFFIVEEAKKTILDISQETVKVL